MGVTASYTEPSSYSPFTHMCLILFAYRVRPETPLIVAANRDEYHNRPAQSAHFWLDASEVLAGRDETAGGTWLGVNRRGRFAAVTNFAIADLEPTPTVQMNKTSPPSSRESVGNGNPQSLVDALEDDIGIQHQHAPHGDNRQPTISRGALASNFLRRDVSATEYAQGLRGGDYQGFNLLLWDGEHLVCTSNHGSTQVLNSGFHGLTNAEFGTRWPKVVDGIDHLQRVVEQKPTHDSLIELLRNDGAAPDERLPRRGRPLEFERRIAPCFIIGEDYGTRASTAVICGSKETTLVEQGYGPSGRPLKRVRFHLSIA